MRGRILVVLVIVSMLTVSLAACGATPEAIVNTVVVEQTVPVKETVIVKETSVVKETEVVEQIVEVVVTPTAAPHPEAVIEGVEPNAEIAIWTFWLSPTFDEYIQSTIARFQEAYPGVTVNWEDHQATFQDDLRNSFAAGNAPDVINLSVGEGWVAEYATNGLLLNLDEAVPQSVKDVYFSGLWEQQLVDGENYQFPWYQGIAVELINRQIYDETGLTVEDFPKTVDGLPALCQTIKETTNTLCDIRLTVNDLLSQMVYEGDVQVMSEDGTTFTFDSPEAVEWLQMYVDMVNDETLDRTVLVAEQDRTGLDLFVSGNAAFYQTGPNLIREVRSNNPGLYGYLAVVQAPVGKSGVVGKGLMGMSVKNDTEFPNASIALAQFFTNPLSMLEFAKVVAVYPSTPASYDDPFFSTPPVAIEDSARPIAKDIISKLADIVPTIPNKADVNQYVLDAVQQALFNDVPAQEALTEAVTRANALLEQ
ncbi:MAG: extracellular solute-binding protein [Planctomycetaceae bacterium]|nr:MAG: extracellular solute-binding protein [Planctomycetaceae bacterium]